MTGEEWRPVVGASKYLISSFGRIIGARGRLMKQTNQMDYKFVQVMGDSGKIIRKSVHSMVCEAFHGPRPGNHVVGHLDGTRTNNRADNLRWITYKENAAQAKAHGAIKCGEDHPSHLLNDDQFRAIMTRFFAGEDKAALTLEFGVNARYIDAARMDPRRINRLGIVGDLSKSDHSTPKGYMSPGKRLDDEQFKAIILRHHAGENPRKLAREFGVSGPYLYVVYRTSRRLVALGLPTEPPAIEQQSWRGR